MGEPLVLRLPYEFLSGAAVAPALLCLVLGCSKSEPAPRPAASASPDPVPAVPKAAFPPLPRPPEVFGPVRAPAKNPTTPAKVALGKKLFFDPALSVDGTRSCYSCHQNEDGTGGHDPLATGARDARQTRHAPTLWNVGYLPHLYWDGRAESLEAQAKAAWAGGNMGVGQENLSAKANEIGARPEYKPLFDGAFPGYGATPDTIVQAISAYERTLFCGDTAFDRYSEGDSQALNADQKAGMELFIGKAACHGCHTPPFFSDAYLVEEGSYHNVGEGIAGKDPGAVDVGRQKLTNSPSDWAAFKTPSLRNITRSAPYGHDGARGKLEDQVRYMAKGGYKNPNLDPKMIDKQLSDGEISQLIAFLGALECPGKLAP
jgi:cytochrome c peroxidase